jgi:hypothetical protein
MTRTALWLAGLVAVVGGTTLWAQWWVNSSEPATLTATGPQTSAPALPAPSLPPHQAPRPPLPPPVTSGGATPVAQVIPLPPLPPPSPAVDPSSTPPDAGMADEPPEFKHLRRLSDPSIPRTRLPPPNAPRIPVDSLIRR